MLVWLAIFLSDRPVVLVTPYAFAGKALAKESGARLDGCVTNQAIDLP